MPIKKKNISGIWILYVIILIGFSAFIIFNDYGLMKFINLKNEVKTLQKELDDTELRLKELDNEIDSLKTNLVKIEKVARERFHMLRKNEKAFRIEKN